MKISVGLLDIFIHEEHIFPILYPLGLDAEWGPMARAVCKKLEVARISFQKDSVPSEFEFAEVLFICVLLLNGDDEMGRNLFLDIMTCAGFGLAYAVNLAMKYNVRPSNSIHELCDLFRSDEFKTPMEEPEQERRHRINSGLMRMDLTKLMEEIAKLLADRSFQAAAGTVIGKRLF